MRKDALSVAALYDMARDEKNNGAAIVARGWVKTNRNNSQIGFIALNDGSCFKNCQIVYEAASLENYSDISKINTGCSLEAAGSLRLTPEAKQPFEIVAESVTLIGSCDEDYPIQKKGIRLDTLREIPHLRPRTNTFMAEFRIRSVLCYAIHQFLQENGFVYIQTPLITANDAEGAGEVFSVMTANEKGDYTDDFFGRHTCLTVSGQLHVEPFAMAFGNVYTFGPTFRAENSNTPYHASEFWMIEPELANADLGDNMQVIEDLVRYCIREVLQKAPDEMRFFNDMVDKDHTLIQRLSAVAESEFKVITYSEGVRYLKESGRNFEYPVEWGIDLKSEHERYLCEEVAGGPMFLTNFPKDIKAFYMRLNDDGETVAACDLLVPGVGELVGGSQREERYDRLVKRMDEMHVPLEPLSWYADLRRYGTVQHAGFGVGLERFLLYLTGIGNIRDTQAYPRTPRNCKF